MRMAFVLTIALTLGGVLLADEPSSTPRPIPVTRPEIKRLLEEMKQRKPRIPLPELTEEEKAKLGERGGAYEARLRALYMSGSGGRNGGGGFSRELDPNMTLDYEFKTMLFWIVSRTNNCHY
jgi:hypothetical protein